jgi:hypothetical protein
MKMDKSISEEGYEHFQMAIKALEGKHYESAIIIPNGATNGDMIKAMFPNARVDDTSEKFGQLSICTHDAKSVFSSDWWNAPYKGVNE